jgi:membrane associated rhomboid family serine protease
MDWRGWFGRRWKPVWRAIMRPWYRYTAKNEDFRQPTYITPFSRLWGFGAPATLTLIALNTVIWIFMVASAGAKWLPMETFWLKYFAMTPDLVIHRHWYFQLLTSVFLHDGTNIWHLFFNMYILWMFGPSVERAMGSRNFVLFYLATGVAGSVLSLFMRLLMNLGSIPSLGASSAVFGVLTAYGFLYSDQILLLFFVVPMKAWVVVIFFVVLESFFVITGWMANVDHFAHLGGAAAAAIWMLALYKFKGNSKAHKWYSPSGGTRYTIRTHRPANSRGFRVIIGQQDNKEHPEGVDNEPPPEWFKL